jgi:hypothetical protein
MNSGDDRPIPSAVRLAAGHHRRVAVNRFGGAGSEAGVGTGEHPRRPPGCPAGPYRRRRRGCQGRRFADFQILYDLYHSLTEGGEPAPELAAAGDLVNVRAIADAPGRSEPGSGGIDWAA